MKFEEYLITDGREHLSEAARMLISDAYNAGAFEMRNSLRCESCKHFKNWCPLEGETGTNWLLEKQRRPEGFFCGLHEPKEQV